MLITCSSCNSKYLVNSADLKPGGRNVQCAKCGHNWYQTSISQEDENLTNWILLIPRAGYSHVDSEEVMFGIFEDI